MDLSTKYLGIELKNPLVISACPISKDVDRILQLESSGASAVVLYSLFAEQFFDDPLAFAATRTPSKEESNKLEFGAGIDGYLRHIKLSKQMCSIPIIGSLNVENTGEWLRYAQLIEQAGADALELNIYMVSTNVPDTAEIIEQRYLDTVAAVRKTISIPLAVKLSPFFSSLPNMANRLAEAGADGLVLFNRFLQPDINIESLEVQPRLTLSFPDEVRLPIRWIAILRDQLKLSLAASSGVHESSDVAKLILAGADIACVASAVMRHGPDKVTSLIRGLVDYMEARKFESLDQMRGFVKRRSGEGSKAFERAGYVNTLNSFRGDIPR